MTPSLQLVNAVAVGRHVALAQRHNLRLGGAVVLDEAPQLYLRLDLKSKNNRLIMEESLRKSKFLGKRLHESLITPPGSLGGIFREPHKDNLQLRVHLISLN